MKTTDTTIEIPCRHCLQPFVAGKSSLYIPALDHTVTFTEESCEKCRDRNEAITSGEATQEPPAKWTDICPPVYARYNFDKLPLQGQKIAPRVFCHPWLRNKDGRGLGLMGDSFFGKSMIMHELARHAFSNGHDVYVTSAAEFAYQVGQKDNDRRMKMIDRCKEAEILLLDDVGKEKMTDRVESDLYMMLEHRRRWLRPLLTTVNSDGKGLRKGMSDDRGEPIVNRIREAAEILEVK